MTTKELRTRLATLPGTFTLGATDLGVPAVEQLFDQSLPGSTLTLTGAQAVPAQLAATGTIALPGVGSGGSLAATVSFSADAGQNVDGLEILVTLDTWRIATTSLTLDLELLAALKFTAARLVLVAEPDATGAIEPEVGVEADLPFQTTSGQKLLTLRGLEPEQPPAGAPVPTSLWELDAQFSGVTLSDLASLAVLATGLPGSAFAMPAHVPVADEIELTELRIVFDAKAQVIVAATVDVQLADAWPIVTDKCELEALKAAFTITYPTTAPKLSAALFAALEIGGIEATASITVPELQLVAQLAQPVDVDKIFEQYFHAAASIPIEVEWLMLTLDATASPPAWSVGFGVGEGQPGGWTLVGDVSLDDVSLEVAGAGTSPQSASLTATFALGETASAILGGGWDATAGWTLSGNTVAPDGLEIGHLLDVFAQKLKAPLPAPLAQLELTYVAMTVAASGPSFTFQVTGDFPVGAATADFNVSVAVSGSPLTQTSTGILTLSIPHDGGTETMGFHVTFEKDPTKTTFTASWSDTPGLGLGAVAGELGVDVSAVPSALLPVLTTVALGYESTGPIVALGVDTQDTRSVWAVTGAGATRAYYGSIVASTAFRLSQLPVIGHDVPPSDDVGIDSFALVAGSATLSATLAQQIEALVSVAGVTLPPLPAKGLDLSVAYQVGGVAQPPLTLTVGGSQPQLTAATSLDTPAPASGPPTAWMNLQRSFGPVDLQRAGASYAGGALWLLLDGSLRAGPLVLGLEGLGVGFVLESNTPWVPKFELSGMSVGYSAPPLSISGAIIDVPPSGDVSFELAGLIEVTAEAFSLAAFGAYADVSGSPSMFVFGAAGAEFGGPPPFFVTGLAGGFGYNSTLRIPGQDEVAQFPLVAGLADPAAFAKQDPLTVLSSLVEGSDPLVSWQLGDLWFAAGLKFSSFELVSTTAVIVVETGQELVIALVGTSEASFPKVAGTDESGPTYAKVILGLEAVFRPTEGSFIATAVLEKGSFVIDPACVLTGGFAFALWFPPNDHAGDFVVTIGGYHPAFQPPPWYPREPRLGFSWSYSDALAISGGAYFALTPSAVMAGGSLDVDFHSGDLHAWLTAYADAIVWWHPFKFSIDVGITIGASYKLSVLGISTTFSVELGADLAFWGPPTGGEVTVHWWVISFTIPFGPGPPGKQEALPWSSTTAAAFEQLLPPSENALVIAANGGVSKPPPSPSSQALTATPGDGAAQPWLVSAYGFQFTSGTPVPASTVQAGSFSHSGDALNIRPMQHTNVTSTHTVKLLLDGTDIGFSKWTSAPVLHDVPKALWGTGDGSRLEAGDKQVVPSQLTGITLTAPPPTEGATPGAVADPTNLESDPLSPDGWLPVAAGQAAAGPVAAADPGSITTIGQQIASNPARTALHDALVAFGVADTTLPNDPMTGFLAGHAFEDPPLVVTAPA